MTDVLLFLASGAYGFAAFGYAWAWHLYKRAVTIIEARFDKFHELLSRESELIGRDRARVDRLWERVNNHHEHDLADIRERLTRLEGGEGGDP